MKSSDITLIIATYNWPSALELCLISVLRQNVLPDEIIIADDGSAMATAQLIRSYQGKFRIPLIHVWHEDQGFRLAEIRNKAIARSSRSYIVQIDGDLILGRHFIQDHLRFRKAAAFVSGTRIQLSAPLSQRIIALKNINISVFSKGITNFSNSLRIAPLRNFLAERYKANDIAYVRGCNMAFWKKDLIRVNGYNEDIVGWGREDSELAVRMVNAGIKKRILKFGAITFHIFHKEADRHGLEGNDNLVRNAIIQRTTSCAHGIDQHLNTRSAYILHE